MGITICFANKAIQNIFHTLKCLSFELIIYVEYLSEKLKIMQTILIF